MRTGRALARRCWQQDSDSQPQGNAPCCAQGPPSPPRSRPGVTPPRGSPRAAACDVDKSPEGRLCAPPERDRVPRAHLCQQAAENAQSHGSRLRRGAAFPSNPRARWVTQGC